MRWLGIPGGLLLAVALTLGWSLARPSDARAESYKYTDKDGVVHFTDNPYDLPEPQRSQVLRRLDQERREQEKRRQQGLDEPPPIERPQRPIGPAPVDPKIGDAKINTAPNAGSPQVDPGNAGMRKHWKTKADTARKKATELEQHCAALRTARDQNNRKGLIFATPGARANAQGAAEELKKCEAELAKAKRYRDVELPEEARKAGVPPGWLRE